MYKYQPKRQTYQHDFLITLKILAAVLMAIALSGCAGNMAKGVSVYDYTHNADGSTTAHIESVNEIKSLKMSINRETGTLDVEVGDLTKRDDVVAVVEGISKITGDMSKVVVPFLPVK